MTSNSPWPAPYNTEHLFASALLAHGPLPASGWSITRDAGGHAHYITPRSHEAKRFTNDVIKMFAEDVRVRYAVKKWTPHHCEQVGRSWKNLFLRWIWEKIDEGD